MHETTDDQKPLHLQLFGGPKLRCVHPDGAEIDGDPIEPGYVFPLSPKQSLLIGLLGLTHPDGLSREQLTNLLWDSGTDAQLSRRLSQLLYTTRRCLGPCDILSTITDSLRLNSALLRTDIEDLNERLASNDGQGAATLFRKGLLADLESDLPDNPRAMTAAIENQLNERLLQALHLEWSERLDSRCWESAEKVARALRELDSSAVEPLRQLLIVLAMQGRFDEARMTYKRFLSDQSPQKEWRPPAPLTQIASLLEHDIYPMSLIHADTRTGLVPSATDFVGRSQELQSLQLYLYGDRATPRILLVQGDDGVGKSRLCNEVLRKTPPGSTLLMQVNCYPTHELRPLGPIVDALQEHYHDATSLSPTSPLAHLLQYEASQSSLTATSTTDLATIDDMNPRLLFNDMDNLLCDIARGRRVVLYIDDLHYADMSTYRWLYYICRETSTVDVTVLATYRPAILDQESQARARFLDHIRATEQVHELQLDDLSSDDAETLAVSLLSDTPFSDEAASLVRTTGSLPLLICEGARYWKLLRGNTSTKVTARFAGLFSERLRALRADDRRALAIICVSGVPLSIGTLTEALGGDAQALEDALDRLEELRLVTLETGAVGPRHELIRRIVLSQMSRTRLVHAHERVARALERSDPQAPGILATHFAAAGASTEAFNYAQLASVQARRAGAFDEALEALEIARTHADEVTDLRDTLHEIGKLRHACQHGESAVIALNQAAEKHRFAGDMRRALEGEVLSLDAGFHSGRDFDAEAFEGFERLRRTALSNRWMELATQAMHLNLRYHRQHGKLAEVKELVDEALKLLQSDALSPSDRLQAASIAGLAVYYSDVDAGYHAARQAMRLASSLEDTEPQLQVFNRVVAVMIARADLATSSGADILEGAERLARSAADPFARLHPLLNRCVWLTDSGQPNAALHVLGNLRDLVDKVSVPAISATYWCNRGIAEVKSCRFQRAQRSFERSHNSLKGQPHVEIATHIHAGLGICALNGGDREGAEAHYEALQHPDFWSFDPTLVARFLGLRLRRNGNLGDALDLLTATAAGIRSRFPLHWVEMVYLRHDWSHSQARPSEWRRDVGEAIQLCDDRGLVTWSQKLSRIR